MEFVCGICKKTFQCSHEKMMTEFNGQKLMSPHCQNCYYDFGKCRDKHGVQCPEYEKVEV